MERFYRENSGRPIYNNDFALLQNELLEAAKASYKGRNAFILNGCAVSGSGPYNISAGLVFIDNELMRFPGVTGITFPYYIYQDAVTLTNYDEYNDNVSRPTRQLVQATGSTTMPGSGEIITMTTGGGRQEADARSTEYVRTVGSQTVNGNKILAGNNTHSGTSTFTGTITSSGNNNFTGTTTFGGTINVNSENLTGSITGNGAIALNNTVTGTRLVSTVTTGTAPLTVASSTKVTDLNAEYLNGFNSQFLVPSGGIIMWSGSIGSIPSGWYLCNGSNSTPDLRDRFIVGAGNSYGVGTTGGANSISLNASHLPAHTHTMNPEGNHAHGYRDRIYPEKNSTQSAYYSGKEYMGTNQTGSGDTDGDNDYVLYKNATTDYVASHTHTINSTGSNAAFDIRPPFYALAYIMKA